MKKYIAEFIGTFFLVLTIVLSVNGGAGNLSPLAIGSMLMVIVYAGWHISGAHYNPAVTLVVFLAGKCSVSDIPGYMISQVLSAILAAVVGVFLLDEYIPATGVAFTGIYLLKAFTAEVIGTFVLVFVIFNVAVSEKTAGNSFYGLAIGFTVTAAIYAFGGISGAVLNPAVAVGVCVAKMTTWSNLWIYVAASFAGAGLAFVVFRILESTGEESVP